MNSIVKRIVLAFVGLYILGLIFKPDIFFPGLGLLFILSPFAGFSGSSLDAANLPWVS